MNAENDRLREVLVKIAALARAAANDGDESAEDGDDGHEGENSRPT